MNNTKIRIIKTKVLFLLLPFFIIGNLNAQSDSLDITNKEELMAALDELSKKDNISVSIIKHRGHFDEDGIPHGHWVTFADSERKVKFYEGEYSNGKKEGEWILYDLDRRAGVVKSKEIWKNDTIKKWTSYTYPDEKEYSIESENGIPIGILSDIRYLGIISNNYCSLWASFNDDGYYGGQKSIVKLLGEVLLQNYVKNTKLSFWGFDEQLEQERYYDEGVLFKKIEYTNKHKEIHTKKNFEYGNLVSIETKTNDHLNCNKIEYYYLNGELKVSGFINLETQIKEGNWFEYFPSGNKKSMGFYWKDKKHGIWKHWDDEGNLLKKEKYKKGKLK